ncbi:hypothetical protein PV328_006078 [Microctonus aethiopoides]|uniref:BED-type domain-containing protein n=1 Tax=Microctonus aethiopoides TaxID=144406 RepID=A0AA39FP46_9HYME|nr:hypothetical protein PV328_006078 [Microctonus aethiopoides]
MSGFKRKRSELLALENESNSGDFSSGNEDIQIPENVSLSDDVNESESSSLLSSSRSSSRMQTQNDCHKSKFDRYFNIELKGTNRDKIGRCKICINSKEIKMARGNTTGLRKQLRNKHPKAYFEIYPEEQKQLAEASTSTLTVPGMFAVKSQLKRGSKWDYCIDNGN